MSDLTHPSWQENDAANNSASPDGFPAGILPSQVGGAVRADRAALKRFFDRINPMVTSGGSATAYTLTYDVGPSAITKGETFTFFPHAANTGSATLNIQTLGAKSILRSDGTALKAGDLPLNGPVSVTYDGTNYRLVGPGTSNLNATSVTATTGTITTANITTANITNETVTGTSTVGTLAATTASVSGTATLATVNASGVVSFTGNRANLRGASPALMLGDAAGNNRSALYSAAAGNTEIVAYAGDGTANAKVLRMNYDGTITWDGYTVWHSNNDGAGSGSDADMLDGLHANQFLRSDVGQTIAVRNIHQGTDNNGIATSVGSLGAMEVRANGDGAAMIAFHRPGASAHAQYLGLDTDNEWAVGGWSKGAARNVLIHTGNIASQTVTNATNATNASNANTVGGLGTGSLARKDTGNTFVGTNYFNGNITVGNGAASSSIVMYDSDHGSRQLHNNSGYIGFLSSGGGWVCRVNDDGALWTSQLGDINSRIESRALAFANDRVAGIAIRRVSQNYANVGGGWVSPAGTVLTGYLRTGTNNGDMHGVYYHYIQQYDPVRGWVGMQG